MHCDLCGGVHGNQGCQEIKNHLMPSEHVDYMGNAPQPQMSRLKIDHFNRN